MSKELIHSKEVHVWQVPLDLITFQIESIAGILSADELARAGRFHFEIDQKRFIAARGVLRQILGHYLEKPPHELQFDYTANGKPVLANKAGYDPLQFNLSHSCAFALYAVSRERNIGIDIERLRVNIDMEEIARRYFSKEEISSLESIHKVFRTELFFQYWTRKEAYFKATGEGISWSMQQCDVTLINGGGFSPVKMMGENIESLPCYVRDLFPVNGYAAAIAVEGGDCNLSCWYYPTCGILPDLT